MKQQFFLAIVCIQLTVLCHCTLPRTERNTFILITSLYNEIAQERIAEYQYCIMHNLAHPLIDHIHVLYDTSNDSSNEPSPLFSFLEQYDTQKLTITKINRRQTYSDNFTIANNLYPHQTIIVANGDIFFDSSLDKLSSISLEHTFLCVTRWDVTTDGKLKILTGANDTPAVCSQDAWIFLSPITIPVPEIAIGTPGCDNRIAYEMLKLGYDIANPCIDIQCCHLHLSAIRNYLLDSQSMSGMVYVPWCSVNDIMSVR